MRLRIIPFLLIILITFTSCEKDKKVIADLVLLNGTIVTMDDNIPKVEAIAIKSDTIQAVGTNKYIEELIGDKTEVIDLKGKFVMPGFFESHAHLLALGESKMELDLSTATNWDEIIAMVVEVAEKTKPGEWIVGRGWHQEKWDPTPIDNVEGYPTHEVLSSATPYNPVLLNHASGHALFANSYAMRLAKIDTSTKAPRGGKIVKDTLNNIIGVFEEEATQLITKEYDKYLSTRSKAEVKEHREKAFTLAMQECLKNGITSFEDAGATFEEIDFYKEMIDSHKVPIRLNVMVFESNKNLEKRIKDYKIINYGNNKLTVRAIKSYIDGALGSRGAWMFNPYTDLPNHRGQNTTPLSVLRKKANIAIDNGFQMCIHAIGDKANREVLNIYENVFKQNPEKKDLRWRVEHAQHLTRKDIPRFAELGVIAAMQGIHATSDAAFAIKRLGRERVKRGAYVWRKLIDSGAMICNGTDAPVEKVNTIDNYYATVTRMRDNGREFFPEEKMTREEALKSYTINGAYAAFQDDKLGSLKMGKLADVVILSDDLMTTSDYKIKFTKIEKTIVGGKIVLERKK